MMHVECGLAQGHQRETGDGAPRHGPPITQQPKQHAANVLHAATALSHALDLFAQDVVARLPGSGVRRYFGSKARRYSPFAPNSLSDSPSMRRHVLPLALTVALAACQSTDTVAPASPVDAALSVAQSPGASQAGQRIPGHYIVVLNDDVQDVPGVARRLAAQSNGQVGFTYQQGLKGFSVTLGSAAAAEALARNPNVAYVEEDRVVTATVTQTGATWGLDRIDQPALPLNQNFAYNSTGTGVTAYIVDTGIRTSHTQFGGRASLGYDAIGGPNRHKGDCTGHGTHVAGTVGGSTYGVAKNVRLVSVRVLGCDGSGTTSALLAGISWVITNRQAPAVANMSLGFDTYSQSVDQILEQLVTTHGVTTVVAAGNSTADACNSTPSSTPSAITVGATERNDARASYSNFGTCVDLFAPGSSITSASNTSNSTTKTMSGTSMAAPHVAGVAALYLQVTPDASPAQVATAIINGATTGVVTGAGAGSPNRLLFTAY